MIFTTSTLLLAILALSVPSSFAAPVGSKTFHVKSLRRMEAAHWPATRRELHGVQQTTRSNTPVEVYPRHPHGRAVAPRQDGGDGGDGGGGQGPKPGNKKCKPSGQNNGGNTDGNPTGGPPAGSVDPPEGSGTPTTTATATGESPTLTDGSGTGDGTTEPPAKRESKLKQNNKRNSKPTKRDNPHKQPQTATFKKRLN